MSKFPRYFFAIVGCCLLLRLTSGAAVGPEDEIALKKGQQFVVKIPGKLLKYETSSISTGAPIFTASVSAQGKTITVEGASDWQTRGWPLMIALYYEKSGKKKEYTEVELRSDKAYIKLRFSPDTSDVNAAL